MRALWYITCTVCGKSDFVNFFLHQAFFVYDPAVVESNTYAK